MMSMSIRPISFTSNAGSSGTSADTKKERVQGVATAAGGTAYIARSAINAQKAEKGVKTAMGAAATGTRLINRFTNKIPRLFEQFKKDKTLIAKSFMKWLGQWQNKKIIGSIIKSPLTKAVGKAFGGTLAVFILVSGMVKTAVQGMEMIQDTANKYRQCRI